MSKYKLIALDLDGTLNNDKREITPYTKEILIKAQTQGAIVVLASGRPLAGLSREAEILNLKQHHGLLLSYNGGKVVDITTDKVLYEKSIPNGIAKKLLRFLENYDVTPIVDDGKYVYTNTPNGFKMQYETSNNNLIIKEVENIADSVDFSPVKILISSPEEILKAVSDEIIDSFKEDISFIFSAPFYLEATAKGISKAESLKSICESLNIFPEEVIAFGDAENDISMLEFAGKGVAMGNSCQALKDVADEITLSNNEDGIAHILSRYF